MGPLGRRPVTARTATAWLVLCGLPACGPATLDGAEAPAYAAPMAASAASHWTVDRLEDEGRAVLETDAGTTWNLPAAWLPEAVREGDVLRVEVAGDDAEAARTARSVRFVRDDAETERRRDEAHELRSALPAGPEGDLEL